MLSREDFVKDLRKKYPSSYPDYFPDSFVYESGREAFPTVNVEDWEELGYVGGKKIKVPDVDVSPDGWNELIVKDINDDSWEWVKHAYANSLQGTLELWKNDKLDYSMKDYEDLGVYEKILAGVGSFLMPLDILTLGGGGLTTKALMMLGKKAAGKTFLNKLATKGMLSKMDNMAVKKTAKTAFPMGPGSLKGAMERMIVEGNTLGVYEAAKGGLYADYMGEDPIPAIASGYAHGAILGGILGGIGGTLEGNFLRYKMLREARASGQVGKTARGGFGRYMKDAELDKLMKYTGPGAQYAAEVGVLEGSSLMDTAANGEFKAGTLLEDFIVNVGFVGLMKGKRKVTSKAWEPVAEAIDAYKKEFAKRMEERDLTEKDLADKTTDGLDKTASDIIDTDPTSAKEIKNASNEIKKVFNTKPEEELIKHIGDLSKVQDEILASRKLAKNDALVTNKKEMIRLLTEEQERLNAIYQVLERAKKKKKIKGNLIAKVKRMQGDIENETTTWKKLEKESDKKKKNRVEYARNWWLETDKGKGLTKKLFEESAKNPEWVEDYIKGKEKLKDVQAKTIVSQLGEQLGFADVPASRKIAKNILKSITSKTKAKEKLSSEERLILKRSEQFKGKISEDDRLALVHWAEKSSRTAKHSLQVGKFLEWFKKKTHGKGWNNVKKEDVYDYLYKTVLGKKDPVTGKTKNKIVSEDIAPFSTFSKWAKGEWVNLNRIEGISYTEANELRFVPVVLREVSQKLVSQAAGAKKKVIAKAKKEWGGTSGEEVDVVTELLMRGVRPEEINKLSAKDFKQAPDGRYFIDMRTAKKFKSKVRLLIKVPKETYNLAKSLGKIKGEAVPLFGHVTKAGKLGGKNISTKEVGSKSLLKAIAEELYGKKDAQSKDMRTALEQLKVSVAEDKLTQQELDAYLGHVIEANPTALKEIYKAIQRPVSDQLDIAEKVESVLGIGKAPVVKKVAKPKVKSKKKKVEETKVPPPPKPEVETIVSAVKQTIKYHEKIKGKKSFLQKFFSSSGEQEQTIAKKNVIIDALHGEFYKKQPALGSIKEFIGIHEEWIERIKKNPEGVKKKFGDEVGDIPWHKKYIDIYKRARKLIKEAKETELPYGMSRGKTYHIIHEGQKTLGIEREQLRKELGKKEGDKVYERKLYKDTKEALGEGVKSLSKLSTDDAVDYFHIINSKDYIVSKNNWAAREATAKRMAKKRGFTPKDLEELLRAIDDDTGGKWENIKTKEVIDQVISFLSTYEISKFEPSAVEKMVNFAAQSFLRFPGVTRRIVTPLWSLLKNPKIGGKLGSEIADSFLDWDVTNARHRGHSSVVTARIRNLLGDDAHMIQFADKQKVRGWKKWMTPEEIAFEKRMNDNTIVLNKRTGKKQFKTKERRALQEWDNFRRSTWSKIFEYTKKWTNKSIAEEFNRRMGEKFVDDYFTRRLSDDALYAITKLKDQPFGIALAKSKLNEYAKFKTKDMKKRKNESELSFKERRKNKIEAIKKSPETIDRIKADLWTYFNMPHHTVYNKFFFERGPLLPRKMEIYDAKNKLRTINTYDESFRDTAEYYGFSMAKYLSTLRHFPEVTELGKEFKLGNWKENMFDILTSPEKRGKLKQGINHEWADYLSMTLSSHLGMKTSPKERHDAKMGKFLGVLSSTGAAAGLSTPLIHGIKNVALGFENSVRHFGMMNTIDGMRRYFDINERQRMIEGGVAEYFSGQVLRTQKNVFEEMGFTKKIPGGKFLTMDWMFKNWNMMTRSEEFARISSAFAGGLYFHQMLDAYKGVKNSFWMGEGKKGNIEDSFRNVFKLSDKEIKWIKDTKHQDFAKKENAIMMASLMQKVEHYSHVSSQGGTSTILLPLWMSQPVWKPLTLFARIATSVTHDLWMNGIRPLQKHGNIMPLLRYSAASTLSGASLYYLYKHVLDQDQMHEMSDDKWKTVMQWLWRAEFLGMFTDVVFNPNTSPFYGADSRPEFGIQDPSFVTNLFQPYMIRSAMVITKGLTTLASDPTNPKTWQQTIKHVLKNTVSGYGQYLKQKDKWFYPEKHEWKGFRTAARSFRKEKGYDYATSYKESARTVYYRDLKNQFWYGSEKDFAKSYYNALNYLDADYAVGGFTNPLFRRKKAMEDIERSLKTLDPVNFTADSKGRPMSKRTEFLNYLKNYDINVYNQAKKAEKEFRFKYRKLLAAVQRSKYKLKYSADYDRY